jgi:hypothetical protein
MNNENPEASVNAASVRRLTYPTNEIIINPAGYQSGVQLLGGADKNNIRLWWNP